MGEGREGDGQGGRGGGCSLALRKRATATPSPYPAPRRDWLVLRGGAGRRSPWVERHRQMKGGGKVERSGWERRVEGLARARGTFDSSRQGEPLARLPNQTGSR